MVCLKQDGGLSDTDNEGFSPDVSSAEILDEMLTHRGEIRHRSMSFNDRSIEVSKTHNHNRQHMCCTR